MHHFGFGSTRVLWSKLLPIYHLYSGHVSLFKAFCPSGSLISLGCWPRRWHSCLWSTDACLYCSAVDLDLLILWHHMVAGCRVLVLRHSRQNCPFFHWMLLCFDIILCAVKASDSVCRLCKAEMANMPYPPAWESCTAFLHDKDHAPLVAKSSQNWLWFRFDCIFQFHQFWRWIHLIVLLPPSFQYIRAIRDLWILQLNLLYILFGLYLGLFEMKIRSCNSLMTFGGCVCRLLVHAFQHCLRFRMTVKSLWSPLGFRRWVHRFPGFFGFQSGWIRNMEKTVHGW